jgi:hypothetical protein
MACRSTHVAEGKTEAAGVGSVIRIDEADVGSGQRVHAGAAS